MQLHIQDFIVLFIILIFVVIAVCYLRRHKGKGCCGSCEGCDGCNEKCEKKKE